MKFLKYYLFATEILTFLPSLQGHVTCPTSIENNNFEFILIYKTHAHLFQDNYGAAILALLSIKIQKYTIKIQKNTYPELFLVRIPHGEIWPTCPAVPMIPQDAFSDGTQYFTSNAR